MCSRRPSEAAACRQSRNMRGMILDSAPDRLGRLTLEKNRPQSGKRWTDSGQAHDERGLKHRAEDPSQDMGDSRLLVGRSSWLQSVMPWRPQRCTHMLESASM
jgi:hypothetical protein